MGEKTEVKTSSVRVEKKTGSDASATIDKNGAKSSATAATADEALSKASQKSRE